MASRVQLYTESDQSTGSSYNLSHSCTVTRLQSGYVQNKLECYIEAAISLKLWLLEPVNLFLRFHNLLVFCVVCILSGCPDLLDVPRNHQVRLPSQPPTNNCSQQLLLKFKARSWHIRVLNLTSLNPPSPQGPSIVQMSLAKKKGKMDVKFFRLF